MNSNDFRKELIKIMPGYSWTVHRFLTDDKYMKATGIQSAGFNRLSTLQVIRREKDSRIEYEVKSAGYGVKSPWVATWTDSTLARALRGLQDHYESLASLYAGCAAYLRTARKDRKKLTPAHDDPAPAGSLDTRGGSE